MIGGQRYYASRLWADRYWPNLGAVAVVVVTTVAQTRMVGTFAPSTAITGSYAPQTRMTALYRPAHAMTGTTG